MKDRRLLLHPTNRYNFLYRTTNLINGKIYVGVHTTDNMNDGYLGSGEYIRKAIKKYGKENFKREVLKFYYHPVPMYHDESIMVDEKFIKQRTTYNKSLGGCGGHFLGAKFIEDHRKRMTGAGNPLYGVGHTEETKKLISDLMQGEKHHLWGKKLPQQWIKNARDKREEKRIKALKDNPLYADDVVDFILTKKEEGIGYEPIAALLVDEFGIFSKTGNPISVSVLMRLVQHFANHGESEIKSRACSILEQLSDPNERYRRLECSDCGKIVARNHFKRHVCVRTEAA